MDCAFAKLQTFLPAYTQDLLRVARQDGRLDTRKTEGRVERKLIIWILDDITNTDIHVKTFDFPRSGYRQAYYLLYLPVAQLHKKPISQVQLCCVR
jgi:hypothetical protein